MFAGPVARLVSELVPVRSSASPRHEDATPLIFHTKEAHDMSDSNKKLFGNYTLGDLTLDNRVVMAPMTRCRAIDNLPNDLMAEYYGNRANAGLIITEGTAPSKNGLGYARIPGAYSDAQVEGWRGVTERVHANGGKIFLQLMHCGRMSHPLNVPDGGKIVAPSPHAPKGKMYTDEEGEQPYPTPNEITAEEIAQTIEEYVHASKNAIEAGFDGVEIHGANGYLIEQFLNPASNNRTDDWGGTWQKRNRFALEVVERVVEAIGGDRVGVRISPYGAFGDMSPSFEDLEEQFLTLSGELSKLGAVYLHLVDHSAMGTPEVPREFKKKLRETFGKTFILSGGYDAERAESDLQEGLGDLVAFGRPYIANPDLVQRFKKGADLNEPKQDLFYTPGAEGYTDYPTLEEEKES